MLPATCPPEPVLCLPPHTRFFSPLPSLQPLFPPSPLSLLGQDLTPCLRWSRDGACWCQDKCKVWGAGEGKQGEQRLQEDYRGCRGRWAGWELRLRGEKDGVEVAGGMPGSSCGSSSNPRADARAGAGATAIAAPHPLPGASCLILK